MKIYEKKTKEVMNKLSKSYLNHSFQRMNTDMLETVLYRAKKKIFDAGF